MRPPRSLSRDLLVLGAICVPVYLFGLTSFGLTNWQEAQRALVARQMQESGAWIVPTIDGEPYLAKPPIFYWCQIALADLRGVRTGELELRLTVALAAILGVFGTYFLARRLLAQLPGEALYNRRWSQDAAFWSAAFLATGLLYVRSGRIGELDMLIVPFTLLAVGAIHAAWTSHRERTRTHWPALLIAILAAIGAALTKGPPALLALAAAGYGGIALHAAFEPDSDACRRRPRLLLPAVLAVALPALSLALSPSAGRDVEALAGLALLAVIGAGCGGVILRLLSPARARTLWAALGRTHPLLVLGLPIVAIWLWLRAVAAHAGPGVVGAAVGQEAEWNLLPLVAQSPVNNLAGAGYAAGLGSLGAILAIGWLWLDRPRPRPGWWITFAWVGLGLAAFSLLGKGVPRYLTPLWPGVAILGGMWMATTLRTLRRPRLVAAPAAAIVLALAAGSTWWYGHALERWHPDRSPRAFLAELLTRPGVSPDRLGSYEFDTPQLDFYAGVHVESFKDVLPRPGLWGVGPRTIVDLHDQLAREGGDFTLLVRAGQPGFMDPRTAQERLRDVGLEFEPLPVSARFSIDNFKTPVHAVRVRIPTSAASAGDS